jgi:energy-coupling factor transporter ATP-binding protein EcfA2
VVVVTQDVEFASAWSQRIVLLSNGRIVSDKPHDPSSGGARCDPSLMNGLFRGEAAAGAGSDRERSP